MSLKVWGFTSYSKTEFYIACPQCDKAIKVNVPKFLVAINKESPYFCVDCGFGFVVTFVGLTRVVEQRDEAVGNGAGREKTTYYCPRCYYPRNRKGNNVDRCPHCGDAKFQAPGQS